MFRRLRMMCCASGFGDYTKDTERGWTNGRVADEPSPEESHKNQTVRRFGWAEIESVTSRFTSAVVGEGGFSTVYLARLPRHRAAVKLCRSSERLQRLFRQELDVLLALRHPHVVRLLGYCDERDEGALVFEFVPNGTLHEKLHGVPTGPTLSWSQRMLIALQLAKALEYLHEQCDPQIIHGDVKASNILLDSNLDVKLCDFGSARVGFSAAVQPRSGRAHHILGSPGYVDPHFLRSGMVTKKSDVYSFGVVLLELITGAEAICPETERRLTAVIGPWLKERDVSSLVDGRLGERFDKAEAEEMAEVAVRCVGENPGLRPSMAEVVKILEEKTVDSVSNISRRRLEGKD